jgi:hypothetical protein
VSNDLRNLYGDGELQPATTIQEFLIVRQEGSVADNALQISAKMTCPTHKDSLTVHQRGLPGDSAVKNHFTTPTQWHARDLEQTIAKNVAEILET